jgi:hypothetical protein
MQRLYGALALLLLANGALADEPVMGFYGGIGIGNANVTLEDADSTADFEADDTAFRIIAGYRLFRYFAIEANYADYGTPQGGLLGQFVEADFSAFHVAAVGLIPLGRVDLFGKLGVGAWEGTLRFTDFGGTFSENNVDPVLGFGVQIRRGPMALRAEVEAQQLGFDDDGDDDADGDDSVAFGSVSFTYSF